MKNIRLAFFYFFSYLCLGCVLSLLIPKLNEHFNLIIKTIILGSSALFSFILSLILGKLSDSLQRNKPSFYISMSIYIIGLTLITYNRFIIFGFVILITSTRLVMSHSETILLIEKKDLFGKYHCIGSIGLILGSICVNRLNEFNLYILCIISSFVCILCIFFYKEKRRNRNKVCFKDIMSLFKNRKYIICVSIFFFLMMMGFGDQYIVIDKMLNLNASKLLISLKYSIQVFMEIPIYLLMNKIFNKFQNSSILLFCIIMSCLKFILYGLASSSTFILITSSLQICTHPLIVLLSKRMILGCTDASLISSSQIIGFAIYYSLSGFIGAIIANILQIYVSYNIIIFIFAFIGIFPLLIWHKYKNMLN